MSAPHPFQAPHSSPFFFENLNGNLFSAFLVARVHARARACTLALAPASFNTFFYTSADVATTAAVVTR